MLGVCVNGAWATAVAWPGFSGRGARTETSRLRRRAHRLGEKLGEGILLPAD